MSWITARNNVTTISIITAAFLFGLIAALGFNVSIDTPIFGIPIAYFLAAGQVYIAFCLIKRYL